MATVTTARIEPYLPATGGDVQNLGRVFPRSLQASGAESPHTPGALTR